VLVPMWERLTSGCDEPVLFDELPRAFDHPPGSLGEVLAWLVARLPQVIAVDVTHRSLRVPVAKVIVPGRATDLEALG